MVETTLLFDVYGTLVDPAGMARHLAADVGAGAPAFAALWREKQVEYAFRRGLMQNYADFTVCTAQALDYCCQALAAPLSEARRRELLAAYGRLPAFADAEPALRALQAAGRRLFAFSNGPARVVETVLAHAGLRPFLEAVISVDDVRLFKPAPAVYAHARRLSGAWTRPCWLVSGNPWDVIGARSAGLDAAWVQRAPDTVFDPWEIEPTLTVPSLGALANVLGPPQAEVTIP